MLYKIVETRNGKKKIKMIDDLSKCNTKIETLRSSVRNKKVKFELLPAGPEDEKFKEKRRKRW